MTIIRLVGGLSPGVGSDPRTFPAIFNAAADLVEANEAGLSVVEGDVSALEGKNIPDFSVTAPSDEQVLRFDATLGVFVPEDLPNTGGLVAVKSAIRDTVQIFSNVGAGDNRAVGGLSITHEVADPANRLIISTFFGAAGSTGQLGGVGIAVHDGTGLINVGQPDGNRVPVTAGGLVSNSAAFVTTMPSVTFVHTPGAGSKTYTVRAINLDAGTGTLLINRSQQDVNDQFFSRAVSSLMIQEVTV